MKKKQHGNRAGSSGASVSTNDPKLLDIQQQPTMNVDEETNQGFSDWLRSPEGVGYMRYFVLANSLMIFMTMSWPHLNEFVEMFVSYFKD